MSPGVDDFEGMEGLDPSRLLSAAQFHRVVPLTFKAFSAADSGTVSQHIVEDFRASLESITFQSLFLTKELLKLLRVFEQEGIEALAYKGPVLSIAAYGNPFLRQFDDIDLVVRESDYARACAVMYSEGYSGSSRKPNACELFHPERRVAVDLHQWIFGPIGFTGREAETLDSESLLARAGYTVLQEHRIRTLRVEDLLVALCMHATRHAWQRWIWLFDIGSLVSRHPDLDWDEVTRRAQQLHVAEPVYLSLRLAETICGSEVPVSALERLQVRPVIREVIPSLESDILQDPDSLRSDLRRSFLPFQTLPTARDKTIYSLSLLKKHLSPTDADYRCLTLPRYLHVLYFGIRPFRLFFEHGRNFTGWAASKVRRGFGEDAKRNDMRRPVN